MRQMSIAALMSVVALSGLALTALRSPSELISSAVYSLVVAALLVAAYIASISRGPRRRFWAAFAVSAGVHLSLGFLPWPMPQLITTTLVERAYDRFGPTHIFAIGRAPVSPTFIVSEMSEGQAPLSVRFYGDGLSSAIPLYFRQTAISIVSVLVGLVGALLACLIPSKRETVLEDAAGGCGSLANHGPTPELSPQQSR